jgi:hypothetical protein
MFWCVFLTVLSATLACAQKGSAADDWLPFQPPTDSFQPSAGFDLRSLNEKLAGDGGFITVKGAHFVHSNTGQSVRFWAVNGPPNSLKDPAELRQCARMLARHGVNLVRIHGGYFDSAGNVDPEKVRHALDIVAAMKSEGIYCHFSIYFPLWLSPKADDAYLNGYDGKKHPFAALEFDPKFQKQYEAWWTALLTTPDKDGKKLIDNPAVMGAEIQNEDSYFFWTFSAQNIPDPELRILEKQFGDWLITHHGSLDAALKSWNGLKVDRDAPGEGRLGFRPLWNIANQKTARDRETATFLLESQRGFYKKEYDFLRKLGFKGVITCSNWQTASPQVLGPLEKYSYGVGDVFDRHGYFSCAVKGPNDSFAIMNSQTYVDRSALRFDPEQPGKPKVFNHPVMDVHYDNKPSMISETTFTRPNRYRSEAPLYYACYGALQGTDCIVHFALDSAQWATKPNYFMQPWTLMSPAMMGQFPAAAMIFRLGLIEEGRTMADINLKISDMENLQGTPLPEDANFDELRAKDLPPGAQPKPGDVIDPLIHYVGRTNVSFTEAGGGSKLENLKPFIDRTHHIVSSSTGQLRLDYANGLLTINAPNAQGLSGNLRAAGKSELTDIAIQSDLELGHIVAVSLDQQPLARSSRILLQVMTEERCSGFMTEPAQNSHLRITNIGHDPWQIKAAQGTVQFKRSDAKQLKVTMLDNNGNPQEQIGNAEQITLRPGVLYYVIGN